MTLDDIRSGCKYECVVSNRVAPVYVEDVIPTGLVGKNLDTHREVFIKKEEIHRRVIKLIENMSEWRLHNGD